MSQRKEKTPEQVLDEEYKIASTRAAEKHLNKRQESMDYWLKTISFQRKR